MKFMPMRRGYKLLPTTVLSLKSYLHHTVSTLSRNKYLGYFDE